MRAMTWVALATLLGGCQVGPLRPIGGATPARLVGQVQLGARRAQALGAEVVAQATIALSDAGTGEILASALTDSQGRFALTFGGFTPLAGHGYNLDAIKGLAEGGEANRAGAPALRLRTQLVWGSGWLSSTNSVPDTGVVISPRTTALAIAASYQAQAGHAVVPTQWIGLLQNDQLVAAVPELSAGDFAHLCDLVDQAVALDQDPLAEIGRDARTGAYRLAVTLPWVASFEPAIVAREGWVTLHGAQFERLPNRCAITMGGSPVASWSVTPDRQSLTVQVSSGAMSGPIDCLQVGGLTTRLVGYVPVSGTVTTLVGAGGGNATTAPFGMGGGCAWSTEGFLAVTDTCNNKIRRMSPTGVVTALGGSLMGIPGQDGPLVAATFNGPSAIASDAVGGLYVVDSGNGRIRRILNNDVQTLDVDGNFSTSPMTPFQHPGARAVAVDPQGTLWIADSSGNCLWRVGTTVQPYGITSYGLIGSGDGALTTCAFSGPVGLQAGRDGLYVAQVDGKIRRLASGFVQTLASNGVFQTNPTVAANLLASGGMALDAQERLWVADTLTHRIWRIAADSGIVQMAGDGVPLAPVDGALSTCRFSDFHGMARGSGNWFYLLDGTYSSARVLVP